jgi:hypothetical protein
MFEVPLGCPKFGLYADYKVNTILFGSPAYTDTEIIRLQNSRTGSWFKETAIIPCSVILCSGSYISEQVIFLKSS